MRIAEFHIESFGCLERLSVSELQPGLSIVLGKNEAGKSTLLAFLRAMLFGFPSRRKGPDYRTTQDGRQGGRLVLLDGNQERITVERYAMRRTKKFTATLRDGSLCSEDQLHQRLGRVTPDVYANVFAFGLGELQDFASLQDDKVRDAIYSAGMGTGKQSPAQLVQQLQAQSEQWFKPRGSVPELNRLLVQLEQQRAALREHAADQDCYQRYQDQRRQAEQRRAELGAGVLEGRQRLAHLTLLSQAREDWVRLVAAREKLETLPAIADFPEDGLARWERLQVEHRALQDQLREARDERREQEEQLSELRVEPEVLAARDEIRRLDRQVELFEKNRRELAATASDRKLSQAEFCKALERLGPEWDESSVHAFDWSLPVQQEIAAAQKAVREASMRVDKQQAEVDRLERQLGEQQEAEQGEDQRLQAIPAPRTELDEAGIARLEQLRATFDAARRDLPQVQGDAQHQEARLQSLLRGINPDWTETELSQFDDSLPAQQERNEHRNRLADLGARLRQAEDRLATAQQTARELDQAVQRDQAELDRWPAGEADEERLRDMKMLGNQLREQLQTWSRWDTEIAHQTQRKEDIRDQLSRLDHLQPGPGAGLPVWLPPALAGLGGASFLLLVVLRDDWLLGLLLLGLALGVAGWLYAVSRSTKANDPAAGQRLAADRQKLLERLAELEIHLQTAQTAKHACHTQIRQWAEALDLEAPPDQQPPNLQPLLGDLQQIEQRIEQQQARNQQRRALEQQRDERREQFARARETRQTAQRAHAELQQQLQQARDAWQRWLRENRLPVNLSPDVARDVLAHVQSARELLQGLQEKRERIVKMQAALEDYQAAIRRVAANSRIDDLPDEPSAAVQELSELRDQQQHLRRRREEAQRRLEEQKQRTARASETLEAARQTLQIAHTQLDMAQQQWRALLTRHGLRETVTVEQIDPMLQAIRDAQKQGSELQRQQNKEATLAREMTRYRQDVAALLSRCGEAEPNEEPGRGDAVAGVQALARRLQQAEQAQQRRDTLCQAQEQLQARIARLETQVGERQRARDQLLRAADTADEEAFRQKARDHAQRQALTAQIEDWETRLRLLAGSAPALDTLQQELQASSPESVQAEQQQQERAIEQLEQQRDEAVRESEQLRVRLEELERSEEISVLRIRHAADLAEFHHLAREWAALQITAHLIDRAREHYERERRPAVLKQAERYFSQFTAGRYREIHTAQDEPAIVAPNGERKTLSQLSRGTSEQLYLSLRFGYVEEFVQQAEPLPLIFDDILVNFDAERAEAAARAIGELAQAQQIVLFTCHGRTARLLKQAHPAATLYELSDGQLTPRVSELEPGRPA